jgi:ribonuclease HI
MSKGKRNGDDVKAGPSSRTTKRRQLDTLDYSEGETAELTQTNRRIEMESLVDGLSHGQAQEW